MIHSSVIEMMTLHCVLLVFSCSSIVLGVELSCNQSNTTCPGDVVQCECQVINGTLQWSAMMPGDPKSEDIITYSFLSGIQECLPYTTVLCSATTSPVTLTSKLTVTSTSTDVTCRSGSGESNTTRLTVAGKSCASM